MLRNRVGVESGYMAPPTKKPDDIVIHDRSAPDQRGGGTVENFEMAGTVFHTRADAEHAGRAAAKDKKVSVWIERPGGSGELLESYRD